MIVIDETTDREMVAVTVAFVRAPAENARQISAVPLCPLARLTSVHVSPPPDTPLTVVVDVEEPSVATNARSNSFGAAVEKAGLATVLPAVDRSVDFWTSTEMAADAAVDTHSRNKVARRRRRIVISFLSSEGVRSSTA